MAIALFQRRRCRSRLSLRYRPSVVTLEDRAVPSGVPPVWTSVGAGGGGSLYAPSINPNRPSEYFISSDMSQLFHSTNSGTSWQMIDFRQIQGGPGTQVQYTEVSNLVYAIDYSQISGNDYQRPSMSKDGGQTWTPLANDPTGSGAFYFDVNPANHNQMVIADYTHIYFSGDAGNTWSLAYTGKDANQGIVIGGAFWNGSNIDLGTNDGLVTSSNGGQNFALANVGGIASGQVIRTFAGAVQGGVVRFLAVTDSAANVYGGVQGYDNSGGEQVYTLDLGAANWTARSLPAADWPVYAGMSPTNINTMYVGGSGSAGAPTVYKSTDGGVTWQSVLQTAGNANVKTGWSGSGGDRDWTYGQYALGLAVDAADPNRIIVTDEGFAHASTDGGASWQALYVAPADLNPASANTPRGKSYHDSGLDNTTSWQVAWSGSRNVMIASTDVRGELSTDGGLTFGFGYTGQTYNTLYRVVSGSNGTLYGAAGSVHDLYQSTTLTDSRIDGATGAVLSSPDAGVTWQVLHNFGHEVSWVATDPTNANRLYASVVSSTAGGIYVTNNLSAGAASTWTRLATPPRTQGHPLDINVLNDGTLVVSFSGRRDSSGAFTASSGVFVSSDGGATWLDRSDAGMKYWTWDVVIDPFDASQNTWYAGVYSGWGGAPNNLGGLYRTTNRGQTWTRVLTLDGVTSVTFNPSDSSELYVTTEDDGLYYSSNIRSANPTYSQVASYPFRQPERVFFSPVDPTQIWATSFGGGVLVGNTPTTSQAGALALSASSFTVNENAGTATITVNRTGGSTGAVTVAYATSDGTATAPADYKVTSGILSWAAGDTTPKTFTIPIVDLNLTSGSMTVNLTLSSPTGGATLGSPATAVLTILDNDPPPASAGSLQFSASAASVNENAGTVALTVTRTGGSAGAVSVQFATANGTATSPADYTATTGTLSWANGETVAKTITVPIIDVHISGGSMTFSVGLTGPAGGATLGSPKTEVVTIVDNDILPPPPSGGKPYAVGTDGGTVATVTMYNSDGTVRFKATPFGTSVTGGLRVATGDVTGDGYPDVVVSDLGAGVSHTYVKIIDGKTGTMLPVTLSAGSWYYGTASLAVGDVTGDGIADIAVGTDDGGPLVRIYRGGDFQLLSLLYAGPTTNSWGHTEVALADMNADGIADLAVSSLYPNGVFVVGINGKSLRPGTPPKALFSSFTLSGAGFEGAPYLAAGDVNGDGYADLAFGSGAWSTPRVLILSGKALVTGGTRVKLADFAPEGTSFSFGIRVALRDLTGTGRTDLIIGAGTGKGSRVNIYYAKTLLPGTKPPVGFWFDAYPGFNGGVYVG